MTFETLRAMHLLRDRLAEPSDPPAVIDALLELRALGCRSHALNQARLVLLSRPVAATGEWLVVTADGHAYRFSHCCLDDETAFESARVVRLASARSDAEGVGVLPVDPPPVASDRGAAGRVVPVPPQHRQPGGSTSH